MSNPLFVFEDIQSAPRHKLGTLLGIPVYGTPLWMLSPLAFFGGMFALSWLVLDAPEIGQRLGWVLLAGTLANTVNWIHSIGHILSGKIAQSPMDTLLLTMTRHINLYEGDQEQYPPRIHITRAAGGPLANLIAGIIGVILLLMGAGGGVSLVAMPLFWWALPNLLFGIGGLFPIESTDGGTIAYWLRRAQKDRKARTG